MDKKLSPAEQVKVLFIGGLSLLLLIPAVLFTLLIFWITWSIATA